MSEFSKRLLDMTEDEMDEAMAHILMDLQDIADATGRNFIITATPDKTPVLIVDGEIDRTFTFGHREPEIPGFMSTVA